MSNSIPSQNTEPIVIFHADGRITIGEKYRNQPDRLARDLIEFLEATGRLRFDQLTAANDRITELEAALKNASERISEIAFDIPAPNGYTPRLVQLSVAIAAAAAAKAISEEPSK